MLFRSDEVPGTVDGRGADVEEIAVAAVQVRWGAVQRCTEREVVCLYDLAGSADARTAS